MNIAVRHPMKPTSGNTALTRKDGRQVGLAISSSNAATKFKRP